MTDIILQWLLTSASARFLCALKTVTFVFHITGFFSIGYRGSVFKYVSKFSCIWLKQIMELSTVVGIQIYGGPGSLSLDFKIWPITFQGSGPSGPIHFSREKSHFSLIKNIHLTASLRTPQNRKYM